MKKLIWLDDCRDPAVGGWAYQYSPIPLRDTEIVWVRSYEEFVGWITLHGLPDAICWDHDLGRDVQNEKIAGGMSKRQAKKERAGTKSGMDCAKWLVSYCLDRDLDIPLYGIQSANPAGKANIAGLLESYKKHHEKS